MTAHVIISHRQICSTVRQAYKHENSPPLRFVEKIHSIDIKEKLLSGTRDTTEELGFTNSSASAC